MASSGFWAHIKIANFRVLFYYFYDTIPHFLVKTIDPGEFSL